jgi:hypothetical protein
LWITHLENVAEKLDKLIKLEELEVLNVAIAATPSVRDRFATLADRSPRAG